MRASNILHLGVKELRSLARDPVMLVLIVWGFTFAVYAAATVKPETLSKAPIGIVDEDRSPLSTRISSAFYLPYFTPPIVGHAAGDGRADGRRGSTPSRWTSRPISSAICSLGGGRRSSSTSTRPACDQAYTGQRLRPGRSSRPRCRRSSSATGPRWRSRSTWPSGCASTRSSPSPGSAASWS